MLLSIKSSNLILKCFFFSSLAHIQVSKMIWKCFSFLKFILGRCFPLCAVALSMVYFQIWHLTWNVVLVTWLATDRETEKTAFSTTRSCHMIHELCPLPQYNKGRDEYGPLEHRIKQNSWFSKTEFEVSRWALVTWKPWVWTQVSDHEDGIWRLSTVENDAF